MVRALSLLVAITATWVATLWFGIKPDFSHWSPPTVLALHLAPLLVAAVIWSIWRCTQWVSARRLAQAKTSKEAAEQTQRLAAQAEALRQQIEELRYRQFACDCRGVAMMEVALSESAKPAFGLLNRAIGFSAFAGEAEECATILSHLSAGIAEALEHLYSSVPGAAVFPIYIVPPTEVAGTEVFSCVQEARGHALDAQGLEHRQQPEFNGVRFLPGAATAADSVLGLFDSTPDLPGVVVLAFDSPWLRTQPLSGADSDSMGEQPRPSAGPPSQGIFALLLTRPDLESRLDVSQGGVSDTEAMTPYWERDLPANGENMLLRALTPEERDSLRQAPVLAHIHRAAVSPLPGEQQPALALTQVLNVMIERAQVNATLIDCSLEGAKADTPGNSPTPDCAWLVHNAGPVGHSGKHLAALGTAMSSRGILVDPIDAATNVVIQGGDFGMANGVARLALTVAHAAEHKAPVLCTEFSGSDGAAAYFATPPRSSD